jgi:nitrite reductase/ring-hydroxylating ferredoxin subunit
MWHADPPDGGGDLPEGKVVRQMLGEVPVAAVRLNGTVHVLADRCSHMSGPLSGGELADGCLTCPWHGSMFRLTDGSVAQGPATAPQPAFEVREAGGAIQVCLPRRRLRPPTAREVWNRGWRVADAGSG